MADSRGLRCAKCGCRDFRLKRTESGTNGRQFRWRYCRNCGRGVKRVEINAAELSKLEKGSNVKNDLGES